MDKNLNHWYNFANKIFLGGIAMGEKVEKVLEEKIKPVLQRDGGDVELIDVNENGVVLVRLQGACSGCPGATMTIKAIIENVLVSEVPGVTQVLGV